jgi:hypothetical protein
MSLEDLSGAEAGWRRWVVWAGRLVTLWPTYVIVSSATWKLTRSPWYVSEWERLGYADEVLATVALIQVACLVLYLLPWTSVLGAVLLTGYLGGAIASYTRIGEMSPVLVPLSTSVTAWLGIFLRDQRLWAVLPLRWGIRPLPVGPLSGHLSPNRPANR